MKLSKSSNIVKHPIDTELISIIISLHISLKLREKHFKIK
jgi:hypothetical protein